MGKPAAVSLVLDKAGGINSGGFLPIRCIIAVNDRTRQCSPASRARRMERLCLQQLDAASENASLNVTNQRNQRRSALAFGHRVKSDRQPSGRTCTPYRPGHPQPPCRQTTRLLHNCRPLAVHHSDHGGEYTAISRPMLEARATSMGGVGAGYDGAALAKTPADGMRGGSKCFPDSRGSAQSYLRFGCCSRRWWRFHPAASPSRSLVDVCSGAR